MQMYVVREGKGRKMLNPILFFLLLFALLRWTVHTSRGRRTLNKPVSCDIAKSLDLPLYNDDSASSFAFNLSKHKRASNLASFFSVLLFQKERCNPAIEH